MTERRRDAALFLGALALLLGMAFAIKRYTGGAAAPDTQNTYVGHYGFAVTLPPATAARMQMFGAFTNAEKTAEVLFVFPRGMKPEEPFNVPEARYKETGIVRVEVNPNKNFPPHADVLAAARYAMDATLKEKKEPYALADLKEAPLPGFLVDIASPTALRQVFLKGEKVHYLATGDPANPVLQEVLDGLAEISPHDEPGK